MTTSSAAPKAPRSSRRLHAVPDLVEAAPKAPRAPRTPKAPSAIGVVGQVRVALQPKNRMATALGALIGGGVPLATYTLAHHEVNAASFFGLFGQLAAWLVLGGLLFSALTVYQWAKMAFGSGVKALGFAVLLEGVLTCSTTGWLSVGALIYLIAINATATGCRLSRES